MKLKDKLADASRRLSFEGCLLPHGMVAQAVASTGVDIMMIDMEHVPANPDTIHAMITATQGTDTAALVRVPNHDPEHVKLVLDMGAEGVIFPLVRTAEEAARCVSATRYPPDGVRGWGAFAAHSRWGVAPMDYKPAFENKIVSCFLIETAEAVENIEAICAVDGVDFVFIAPFDLSTSLEISGQFDHPKFKEAVARIEAAALDAGVPLGGGPVLSEVEAKAFFDKGYRIVGAFDLFQLKASVAQLVSWTK